MTKGQAKRLRRIQVDLVDLSESLMGEDLLGKANEGDSQYAYHMGQICAAIECAADCLLIDDDMIDFVTEGR
jgi:hypothetical protein